MKKSNQYVLKIVGCMVFVMICAIIVFTYPLIPQHFDLTLFIST